MMDESEVGLAILHGAADAVVASDREGRIIAWNRGAERIFGFTRAEAMMQSLDIIIPEPLRARHWEGYHQVMATGESRYSTGALLSVPALRKDGQRISVQFTIVPVTDGAGRMRAMVAVLRDQTAQFEEMKALRRRAGMVPAGA